ncbi:ATP/GTP-binding protein [Euzebya sp.]|uniref:ATP/GTP-binding protein n=1 Tax=Euzebya sp. TaxID=1971409 RepID=UPI0035121FA1
MSKGARRKRKSRPWQNPDALQDMADIFSRSRVDPDLQLDGYDVQDVPDYKATKEYICPDCGNAIPEGESHVVVFPTGDADLRRHWHTYCWRIEVGRSNGAA